MRKVKAREFQTWCEHVQLEDARRNWEQESRSDWNLAQIAYQVHLVTYTIQCIFWDKDKNGPIPPPPKMDAFLLKFKSEVELQKKKTPEEEDEEYEEKLAEAALNSKNKWLSALGISLAEVDPAAVKDDEDEDGPARFGATPGR